MQPTVGRIVHYMSYGTPNGEYMGECRAAVVTTVGDEAVGLCVLNPTGAFFNPAIPYDGGVKAAWIDGDGNRLHTGCGGLGYPGGTWHWPAQA